MMKLKKTIKYAIKNLVATELFSIILIILWFFYISFIPEHWMKLMLLSIAIIAFINFKYNSKKIGRK